MTQAWASKYKGGMHVHLKATKRGSMTINKVQFYQDKVALHKLHQSWSIMCLKFGNSCIAMDVNMFGKPLPQIALEKKEDSFLRVPQFDL